MTKRAPTVYAFMDESGDPGGALEFGASPHFVVVMVETTEPELLHTELKKLRFSLNLPQAFEFRYHDTQMPWARAGFFKLFRSLDVRVRAGMIDKVRLPKAFSFGQHALYKLVIGELVVRASPSELTDAVLVIDGKRGAPTDALRAALRQHLSRLYEKHNRLRAFAKIVVRAAKAEDGLQFADMVAGVLAERFEHGESVHDEDVESKLVDLWKYPDE